MIPIPRAQLHVMEITAPSADGPYTGPERAGTAHYQETYSSWPT